MPKCKIILKFLVKSILATLWHLAKLPPAQPIRIEPIQSYTRLVLLVRIDWVSPGWCRGMHQHGYICVEHRNGQQHR